ncbi:copper homeostasis protein CutC [Propionigenium maris DSM 9537]|uniref:PF03932 family protein CutC n=1 Tax=Propionigenium maris DSM 9537 TaxID=1123000 RepID=A0A9W6LQ80_9FUSO|nr:copper homeostasis protein CutC [Propionigenium maris]GLI58250.1 copper homeostasis protein CutC [Propionigenium maris DSM 9537]
MIREACVGSYIEAKRAEEAGAGRIELCDNLFQGGTTPSYGTVKKALEEIRIPVLVMVRPRGGDFCYSSQEVEIMIENIRLFRSMGVGGVVLGVLTKDKKIDYPLLKRLLGECSGMEVTFHKAIDEVEAPVVEVEKLAEMKVTRILTSGKAPTALEGEAILNEMLIAAGERIEIVVAGGVTEGNLDLVRSRIPATEFHGRRIVGDLTI